MTIAMVAARDRCCGNAFFPTTESLLAPLALAQNRQAVLAVLKLPQHEQAPTQPGGEMLGHWTRRNNQRPNPKSIVFGYDGAGGSSGIRWVVT